MFCLFKSEGNQIYNSIRQIRIQHTPVNKRDNIILIAEQSSMFHISNKDKYTHFKKKYAIFFSFKIYMQCTNLNTTQF